MAIVNIAKNGGLQIQGKVVGDYTLNIELDNLDNLQIRIDADDKAKLQAIKGIILGDYFFTKNELNFAQSGTSDIGQYVQYDLGRSGLRARMNELDEYDIDVIAEFGVKSGVYGENAYEVDGNAIVFTNGVNSDNDGGEIDVYVGQYESIDALPNDLKGAVLQVATNLYENRNDGKKEIYTADIKNTLSKYIVRGC